MDSWLETIEFLKNEIRRNLVEINHLQGDI